MKAAVLLSRLVTPRAAQSLALFLLLFEGFNHFGLILILDRRKMARFGRLLEGGENLVRYLYEV